MYQCEHPVLVHSLGKIRDGKHVLRFGHHVSDNLLELRYKYGKENVFTLPCGKCESCRKNKASEWAIRCSLEAESHPYNYFLTLTFDDFHIGKACKEDLNKFLDNLSGFKHVNKFKFFGCQEYGELTHRLHFHLVLFCDFELDLYDATLINGYYYYHSKKIDSLWKFGLYNIAPFEHNCARYVAKYSSKDGSKLFMSRNLGKKYCLEHKQEFIDDNFVFYADFGDKFHQVLPSSCLRWFLDDAEMAKEHKKYISYLITCEKMRVQGTVHEEDVIHTEINRLQENVVKRRLF